MTKFLRNPYIPSMGVTQSLVSDKLAELWVRNGNTEIRDAAWPDLRVVDLYIVTDGPVEADK